MHQDPPWSDFQVWSLPSWENPGSDLSPVSFSHLMLVPVKGCRRLHLLPFQGSGLVNRECLTRSKYITTRLRVTHGFIYNGRKKQSVQVSLHVFSFRLPIRRRVKDSSFILGGGPWIPRKGGKCEVSWLCGLQVAGLGRVFRDPKIICLAHEDNLGQLRAQQASGKYSFLMNFSSLLHPVLDSLLDLPCRFFFWMLDSISHFQQKVSKDWNPSRPLFRFISEHSSFLRKPWCTQEDGSHETPTPKKSLPFKRLVSH